MMVTRFDVDPKRGKLTSGFEIPRHTALFTETQRGIPCRFRTCYPVTLWPLKVLTACLEENTTDGPVLWLRLQSQGVALKELTLNSLRFSFERP